MDALSCPPKYKRLGSFAPYYEGKDKAPYMTVFVGGNHEASNYLRELHYGGWVAPNIYFMGVSSVINVTKKKNGEETSLRIGGISGIEKFFDYKRGYYEKYPFDRSSGAEKSMYHIREFEVEKLKLYT